MEKLIEGDAILNFIPQRPPFIMIDKLFTCSKSSAHTGYYILKENIFCINGVFTEPGLIENIAQSAAAGLSYYYKILNSEIPIGYIASIKNLKVYKLPSIETEINTRIRVEHEVFNFIVISGAVFYNDQLLSEGEMKIFLKL